MILRLHLSDMHIRLPHYVLHLADSISLTPGCYWAFINKTTQQHLARSGNRTLDFMRHSGRRPTRQSNLKRRRREHKQIKQNTDCNAHDIVQGELLTQAIDKVFVTDNECLIGERPIKHKNAIVRTQLDTVTPGYTVYLQYAW